MLGFTAAATVAGGTAWLDTALTAGFGGTVLASIASTGARNPLNAILRRGPLAYFGKISYGIYMVHIMVFIYFGWFDQRMNAYGVAGNLAVVAFRVVASIAAASVLWYGFESRILKLKRYFRKLRQPTIFAPYILSASFHKFVMLVTPGQRGPLLRWMGPADLREVNRERSDCPPDDKHVNASMPTPLTPQEVDRMNAYWRAANYLSVGQIYLKDNPLLERPLTLDDIKPRLLGHWGTTPGLNFLYVHWNRLIRERNLDMIFVIGPGHGGPGIVANTYLEASYTEIYPHIEQNSDGIKRLFRQFSWPYGIPSHVAPETPGSIHEGGELGYSLVHAYGAAFDNPNLIVACVVGDGEAETGPLATSWHSNKFLNPATDGAVLPILHLNGYKIANPTVLARIPHAELEDLMRGYGYEPFTLEGDDPAVMHQKAAAVFDTVFDRIAAIQQAARIEGVTERPRWPMLIMRTPKGWTGPKFVDGKPVENTWRAHQVPFSELREKPEHLKLLEEWMQSYKPEELFDEKGAFRDELAELAPKGRRRMGMNPHANGGLLMQPLRVPNFRDFAVKIERARQNRCRIDTDAWAAAARRDASQSRPSQFPRGWPR